MASATPDVRLPSQPQGLLPPIGWYQIVLLGNRNTCVNNLPRVALNSGGEGGGWKSNLQPIDIVCANYNLASMDGVSS